MLRSPREFYISRQQYKKMDKVLDQLEERNRARATYNQVINQIDSVNRLFQSEEGWSDDFYISIFPWIFLQWMEDAPHVYTMHTGQGEGLFSPSWLIDDYWNHQLMEYYREPEVYDQPVTLGNHFYQRRFCNLDEINRSYFCGCCYCGQICHRSEITDWMDDITAICPYCNHPSLLADLKHPINLSVLR